MESIIRGVSGFVSYTLLRTDQGGVSVTVCQDKTGTDESVKAAPGPEYCRTTVYISLLTSHIDATAFQHGLSDSRLALI